MSEFLASQMGKKRPEIAMPPLPPEAVTPIPIQDPVSSIEPTVERLSSGDGAAQESATQETTQDPVVIGAAQERPSYAQATADRQQDTAQAKNFRELREKAERAAREAQQAQQERDALAQRIKELELMTQQKDEFSLAPDDLVEGKHLSRHIKELKEVKDELNRYRQQTHQQSIEAQLRTQYADFDTIVTKENLDTLAPSVQKSLKALAQSDLMAAGEAAYEILAGKKTGFQNEAALVEKNSAKPRPLTSMSPQQGDSPLSKANAFANGLTPDLQKQLLKEMQQARKGY